MKFLTSLSRVVPEKYLAPSALFELLLELKRARDAITAQGGVSAAVKRKLAQVEEFSDAITSLTDDPNLTDLPAEAKGLLDKALALFPAANRNAIKNSENYKNAIDMLDRWENLTVPISQQTQGFSDEIEFTKAHTSTVRQFDVGINVTADAKFTLALIGQAQADKKLNLIIGRDHVLINQDVRAGYNADASVEGVVNAIQLGAGLNRSGSVEFDSYFQVASDTPTYQALWAMYRKPVMPWSLASMQQLLLDNEVNRSGAGYRAVAIKTASSFTLTGSLGVGRSLITKTDIDGHIIDIDASAEVTVTRQHKIEGDVAMLVSKNTDNQIELTVTLQESEQRDSAFNMALNAQIKGMDKLAAQYVEVLLGKGDELLAILEKYSAPGELLAAKLQKASNKEKWYAPIAQIALGQERADEAIQALIDEELISLLDHKTITAASDANQVASMLVDKLLDIFDVAENPSASDAEAFAELRGMAEAMLVPHIKDMQKTLNGYAKEFADSLKGKAREQLQPVIALGEEVAQALNTFNTNINERFVLVAEKYQAFKQRLTQALEKSANIKLGLAFDAVRTENESDTHKMVIRLLDPGAEGVKSLYRCLALGDDQKASRLMASLEKSGKIELVDQTVRLRSALRSTSTLGMSVIGYKITQIKDVMSQLDVQVDANGNLYVKYDFKVAATASGLEEHREAELNLTYGIAQAALNPNFSGALGIEYTNQDNALHTYREVADFFDSLDLSDNELTDTLPDNLTIPILFTQPKIDAALNKYKTLTQSTAPTRYTRSKISMSLRANHDVYRALLGVNSNTLFNKAIVYLVCLSDQRNSVRDDIISVLAEYARIDDRFSDYNILFDHLFGSEQSNSLGSGTVKRDFRNLDTWEQYYSRWPARRWNKTEDMLERYGRAARALRHLPTTLTDIEQAVKAFDVGAQPSVALANLNSELKRLNNQVQDHLDVWLAVEGILQNSFNDLLSRFGWGTAGINMRLLIFLLLLADSIHIGKPLFLATVTLSNKDEDRKVIVV